MNIELKINGKAIDTTKKVVFLVDEEQIKKACVPEVKIRPDDGEDYWNILSDAEIRLEKWENIAFDIKVWNAGNGFFTRKEAEKELAKRQAIQRVKDYILENGMYWEPDWSDDDIQKYFFCYGYDTKRTIYDYQYCCKFYSPIGYLKSEEDANKVLKYNKEDLELIYK